MGKGDGLLEEIRSEAASTGLWGAAVLQVLQETAVVPYPAFTLPPTLTLTLTLQERAAVPYPAFTALATSTRRTADKPPCWNLWR